MKQDFRTWMPIYIITLAVVIIGIISMICATTNNETTETAIVKEQTLEAAEELNDELTPITIDDLPAQKLSRQEAHEKIQAIVDRGNPDYGAVVYGGADMDIGMSLADFAESKPMYKPDWLSMELYCRMVQLYNGLDDTTLQDGIFIKECHIMLPLLNLNRDIKALPQPISPS